MKKRIRTKYMHEYHKKLTKNQQKRKAIYDKKWRALPHVITKKRIQNKLWNRKNRLECLIYYGGNPPICKCCGEHRIEFLGIDHIKGGGQKHRKSIHVTIYRWLKANNFPTGFRILCHNCNMAKSFYGYCPHTKEKIKRRLKNG